MVAVEPDPHMLRFGRRRTTDTNRPIRHVAAAGERLPSADATFDTVVATLVLCSVDELDATAAELRRVLSPSGRLLVLDHVRGKSRRLARRQDRLEHPWMVLAGGCHPNRDSAATLARHGFDAAGLERFALRPSIPLVAPHARGAATPA